MKRFTIILPLLIAIVALVITLGIAAELQQVKAQIEDVTNYNGLHLSQSTFGTATPQMLIQNSGSANSLEIRDGSATPIVYVDADGNSTFAGTVDLSGATVSGVSTSTLSSLTVTGAAILNDNLTVDGTLAVTGATTLDGGLALDTNKFTVADTSGNTYIGGTLHAAGASTFASTVALTQVNAAGAAGNPFDYTGTLGAMTSDDFTLFDVNITNADHTGSNTLQVLDIASITGDAETTETAIMIGTGWDAGLDLNGTPLVLGADGGVTLDETSDDAVTLGFGAGTGILTVGTGNLKVGAGTAETAQDGQDAYFSDRVEIDGIVDLITNTEHIGIPSIATTSFTYTAAAGGTGVVATIADGEVWLVTKVLVEVTENFDTTGDDATLTIGDGTVANGFVTLADAELQAADTEASGFAAGWQGMAAATIGGYLDANENGFIYAPSGADETIDYVLDETSGETFVGGSATIYVFYTRIK